MQPWIWAGRGYVAGAFVIRGSVFVAQEHIMAIHSQAWFTLFAAAAALHFSTSARADDCNNNGIDDCTDIDAGMADTQR